MYKPLSGKAKEFPLMTLTYNRLSPTIRGGFKGGPAGWDENCKAYSMMSRLSTHRVPCQCISKWGQKLISTQCDAYDVKVSNTHSIMARSTTHTVWCQGQQHTQYYVKVNNTHSMMSRSTTHTVWCQRTSGWAWKVHSIVMSRSPTHIIGCQHHKSTQCQGPKSIQYVTITRT